MLESSQQQDGDLAAQVEHWKSMARKHETRAKANASAATRLQQIEDANKTELQRAQDAQAAAERERDEARGLHSRMMAAASNNLPVELIDHLGAGTDEEINERAELFAQVIEETAQAIAEQMLKDAGIDPGNLNQNGATPQQPQHQLAARPVESMRPGSAPVGATPLNNEQWFRNLLNRT
jgi:catalase